MNINDNSASKFHSRGSLRTTLPRVGQRVRLVRFEDASGDGLFLVARDFETYFETGMIRVNRKALREVRTLVQALRQATPPASWDAYCDTLSRRPVTWFRASAEEQVRAAERLAQRLNRYGADVRRIETDRPPPILWEDAVQVVTRRPRGPAGVGMNVLTRRHRERRKKLERFRARASRRRLRRGKWGL